MFAALTTTAITSLTALRREMFTCKTSKAICFDDSMFRFNSCCDASPSAASSLPASVAFVSAGYNARLINLVINPLATASVKPYISVTSTIRCDSFFSDIIHAFWIHSWCVHFGNFWIAVAVSICRLILLQGEYWRERTPRRTKTCRHSGPGQKLWRSCSEFTWW